jgi:hypothetical protein
MQRARMMRKMLIPDVLIIIKERRQNLDVRKITEAVITTLTKPAPNMASLWKECEIVTLH